MYEIIPSPGTENKSFSDFEKKFEAIRTFARTIHIDIVDGKFAPNTTFADPKPFAKYTKDFLFEIHLMVDEPINYIKSWAEVGAQRFIGHVEKMSDQIALVAEAQQWGEVGLALDKQTSIDAIFVEPEDLDAILVMTIQAGLSGQQFEEALLKKVEQLSQRTTIPIEVDGGINDKTIAIAAAHGASRFVATSFLFNQQTPQEQYRILLQTLENELKARGKITLQ